MYELAEIPNGKISYYTLGHGEPLILLTGFSGTFLHWNQDFLNEISKKYKVFCVNYRGVGYSEGAGEISIQGFAQDLLKFMNSLNIEKAAILGYSMGGYVAQEFALHYPEKLTDLYLVATRTAGKKVITASPEVNARLAPRELSDEERIEERLFLNFPPEYHDKMRPIQKSAVEKYSLPECQLNLRMLSKQRDATVQWHRGFAEERYEEYAKINVPTKIFCGMKDLIIPYQNSLVLCEMIQRSVLIIYEDGGHGILNQYPKEISYNIIKKII